MDTSPLLTEADFDTAMTEVATILAHPPEPGSARERRLDDLLGYIAEYHDAQPIADQTAKFDQLQALDAHLRRFGKQWRRADDNGRPEHWAPMLGGDLDPAHHGR